MDRVCVRDDENENHKDENNDPEQESANGNYSPHLQSENVLGHKIEGIAAMQTKGVSSASARTLSVTTHGRPG